MKGLNWKAVFAALAVFVVGGGTVEILLERAFGLTFRQAPTQGLPFVVCIVLPLIISALLAGYVAASDKSLHPNLNIVSFVVIKIALDVVVSRHKISHHHSAHQTTWQKMSLWALFFGLPFLGGYIRSRRQPKAAKLVSEVLQPPIPLP